MIRVYILKNQNLSGQLGQDASKRRITITGNFTYNPPAFATVNGTKDYLRNQITAQGWNIINFDLPVQTHLIDLTSVPGSINLTVDVPGAYSNDQHLNFLYGLLNSYNVSTGLNSVHPFSGVFLQWTGEEKSNYTPPKQSTGSGTPTPNPTPRPNNTIDPISNAAQNAADVGLDAILKTVGLGGISVGTLALVGVAVVLIRRR